MTAVAVSGTFARPGGSASFSLQVSAPAWLQDATLSCKQAVPDLFFPENYGPEYLDDIKEAKALCRGCKVREACLEWAVSDSSLQGIWAATTPPERRRIRRERKMS